MTRGRWVLVGGAVVAVIAVAAVVMVLQSLDSIVAAAIEKYGSEITGTRVTVDDVEITLSSGKGTIRGLRVANPEGFQGGDAFVLGEITLQVDPSTLTGGAVVVDQIDILGPQVHYVAPVAGRSNIDAILANVRSYGGATRGGATPASEEGPETQLVIKRFRFLDGQVSAQSPAIGSVDAKLPGLEIRDLGAPNGAPPSAIGTRVAQAYTQQVLKAVAVAQVQGQLDKQLEKLGKEGSPAAEALRGLFDKGLK